MFLLQVGDILHRFVYYGAVAPPEWPSMLLLSPSSQKMAISQPNGGSDWAGLAVLRTMHASIYPYVIGYLEHVRLLD